MPLHKTVMGWGAFSADEQSGETALQRNKVGFVLFFFPFRFRPFVPHIPFDFYVVSNPLLWSCLQATAAGLFIV